MSSKLSQPGCHTNTSAGGKSGRSVVKLEEIPVSKNSNSRFRNARRFSDPRRKVVKKGTQIKKGKKIVGRKCCLLQFGSNTAHSPLSPRENVTACKKQFSVLRHHHRNDVQPCWQAGKTMKENHGHLLVNQSHIWEGNVPGVEVGDCFGSRAELSLVGLHRASRAGIGCKLVTCPDGGIVSAAVSVVVSGGYEDDVDEGEVLIYTGEGGNDFNRTKRQIEDQKLEGGNLGLLNSRDLGIPVRVIRGHPDESSNSGTTYSYDGLYEVKYSQYVLGISNFYVYQFKLVRVAGQRRLHLW